MKLWHIPDPWDYHGQGGYAVMAKTSEAAIEAVKKQREEDREKYPNYTPSSLEGEPKYSEITEVESGIYADGGCDD